MALQINLFAILFLFTSAASATECQRECGGISVPYPFGLGNSSDCYKDSSFKLTCNNSRTRPLISGRNIPLLNLSVEQSTAIVELPSSIICYDEFGEMNKKTSGFLTLTLTNSFPFAFSSTANKFTAFGCNTIAYLTITYKENPFSTGCVSTCRRNTTRKHPTDFENITSCSGSECCQAAIPDVSNLRQLNVSFGELYTRGNQLMIYNSCSYAFLGDANIPIREAPDKELYSQAVLDWAIGNKTCKEAERTQKPNEHLCGPSSNCTDSANGPGYRCSCWKGYEGNPYTTIGCKDIDECSPRYKSKYPCKEICKNKPGSYSCQCSFGYHGDPKAGCRLKTSMAVLIAIGVGVLVTTSILSAVWFYKRKASEKNHRRNGGLLLEHLTVKIYKEVQLEKATKNFDSRQLLGEGGNAWVYKGSFEGMIDIAVKKSKVVDQNRIEQFLNEADIVSKINHKNLVKLLGVCLNSKVPMLVYEFVPNGTLYQHIHGSHSRILELWRICLRIAAETAQALEYIHSLADPPIIHRDVKSSNILLDENYTAKVADFGASKLVRLDRTTVATQRQGTLGYMDPEYLQTGELTTKSDVYGFGVVLMELLTKRKPISRGKFGETISLVKDFVYADESNQLHRELKVAAVTEDEIEQVHKVAKLAIKCVEMKGKDRPTMAAVVDVLNGMSREYQSVEVMGSDDEVVSLLDDEEVPMTSMRFELEYPR